MKKYIVPIAAILLLAVSASAPAREEPANVEAAKACTKECGKKHGTGMANDKRKYDAAGYESCMSDCMKGSSGAGKK
jgi:hypothetical protein